MGQATLDLPDPLEQPPESAAGTDELLAQLAGDEIDRLIAQSDPEAASAPSPEIPPTEVASAFADPVPAVSELPPAEQAPSEENLGEFLGKLEAERPAETPSQESKPKTTSADVSPREAALNKLVADADSFEEDSDLAAAERGALKTADADSLQEALTAKPSPVAKDDFSSGKVSIFVRLLAWINSPLDSLSDNARDLVGKVAILTTVNAISVLVYVLFFRRHHG